jgi:hypothetical protein
MKTLLLSSALILLALGLNISNVSANSPNQNETQNKALSPLDRGHQHEPSQSQAKSTDPITPTLNEHPGTTVQKDNSNYESTKSSEVECPPMWSGTCADWAMVGVTFGAVFVGLCTLIAIRVQVRANKDAVVAALKTAEAVILAERAYVFVEASQERDIQPSTPIPSESSTIVHMKFTNCGKTPAIIRQIFARLTLSKVEPTILRDAAIKEWNAGVFIAPGDSKTIPISFPPFPDYRVLDVAESGAIQLYCIGAIKYRDVMDNRRETGFCWQYSKETKRFQFVADSDLNYLR